MNLARPAALATGWQWRLQCHLVAHHCELAAKDCERQTASPKLRAENCRVELASKTAEEKLPQTRSLERPCSSAVAATCRRLLAPTGSRRLCCTARRPEGSSEAAQRAEVATWQKEKKKTQKKKKKSRISDGGQGAARTSNCQF